MLGRESERAATMGKELVHWVRLQIPQVRLRYLPTQFHSSDLPQIEDGNTFGVEVRLQTCPCHPTQLTSQFAGASGDGFPD